ncbi:hypothetical protein ACJMK2_041306 [Sinanodonta woodiana]|uniref:Uncharacterized protein n=1 Tax=Sinanodonta woodiana TaxID=1069815 RepID=A0ABD3W3Q0_SINWO
MLVGKLKQLQENESQVNKAIQQHQQVEKSKSVTAELIALQQLQQQVKQQEQTIEDLKKTVADNNATASTLQQQQINLKKIMDDDEQLQQQVQHVFANIPAQSYFDEWASY